VDADWDVWTRRLSTRAQVAAIEQGPPPGVVRFRKEWLPDGKPFESREQARRWLETQSSKNGTELAFDFDDDARDSFFTVHASESRFFEQLAMLTEKLAEMYRWTPASARAWIFTKDARPRVPAVEVTLPPTSASDAPSKLADLFLRVINPKITLEIAPDTPTAEVATIYENARTGYEKESGRKLAGGKPMADWTLELITFVVLRNDGRAWHAILDEWNVDAPRDWRFDNEQNLSRAAKKGYETLMESKLNWKGPRGRAAHRKGK
jgi:hypothetical protein